MTSAAALWLTEAEVADVLDMESAIAAVTDVFRAQGLGHVVPMHKTHVRWGGGHTLHAIGAVSSAAALAATKTWAHTAGGAEPLLVLWDAETGALQAVVEAFVLGQFRTAAVSGLATDLLAVPEAARMAMIGCGRQALPQVAAVASVRDLDEVQVFSPTAERRSAFAARVEKELGITARACGSVEEAVAGAGVITLATRAVEPIITASPVGSGAHVNAIGAITPERVEMAADFVDRADLLVVDDLAAARELSTELGGRDSLIELSELVGSGRRRPTGADVTVFKAMGTGSADLALGAVCLASARERGLGHALPERRAAAARLTRRARATEGAAR
jgi:alanine dehydrogenase